MSRVGPFCVHLSSDAEQCCQFHFEFKQMSRAGHPFKGNQFADKSCSVHKTWFAQPETLPDTQSGKVCLNYYINFANFTIYIEIKLMIFQHIINYTIKKSNKILDKLSSKKVLEGEEHKEKYIAFCASL